MIQGTLDPEERFQTVVRSVATGIDFLRSFAAEQGHIARNANALSS
jgi:hypothetical protein